MSSRSLQEPEIVEAQVIDSQPMHDPNRSLASTLMPCSACGTPRQTGSRFCVSCGVPFETPNQKNWEVGRAANSLPVPSSSSANGGSVSIQRQAIDSSNAMRTFRCESCGSEVDAPLDQRSLRCPFCDSAYVAELPLEQRTSQRPEFIIGFEVTSEKAQELFFQWIGKNSFFRPGD